MKHGLTVVALFASCANAPPSLSDCSLDHETACIGYAAATERPPPSPHGRLVVGLSARAAELPPGEALDYHLRIVELVEASEQPSALVARRATASFLVLARRDLGLLREFEWSDDLETGMDESSELQSRLQRRAEFGVRYGDLEQQAEGGVLIADGLSAHAELLAAVEIPTELTAPAEIAFRQKLDGLVDSLRQEATRFRRGVVTHCTRYSLATDACSAVADSPDTTGESR